MSVKSPLSSDWETMFERRSIGRTTIYKGALLHFSPQLGVIACEVRDVTNSGAGVRISKIDLLPLEFELSFDGFHTARKCRLIWRQADFLGVAFQK